MRRLLLLITTLVVLAGCGGGEPAPPDQTVPAAGAAPFDRAFIDGMVPHHEGAIEMAKAAKDAGLSQSELVEIANAIIATQQQEIDQMKAWRGEWFGSSEINPMGAETLGLSEDEMGMQHDSAVLANAVDVDAAFAAMMIDHHNGAIAMARLVEEKGQHEEVRDLAAAIIAAQEREVAVMERHAAGDHDGH